MLTIPCTYCGSEEIELLIRMSRSEDEYDIITCRCRRCRRFWVKYDKI